MLYFDKKVFLSFMHGKNAWQKVVRYTGKRWYETFFSSFTRVFYLIDMINPTKMDIKKDLANPPECRPHLLHHFLQPKFTDTALNAGVYKVVYEGDVSYYLYHFNLTTAASDANSDNL